MTVLANRSTLRLLTSFTVSHHPQIPCTCFYSTTIKGEEEATRKKTENDVVRGDSSIISPPDELSNLRRVKFYVAPKESDLEKMLRIEHRKVQDWNEKFWREHNSQFLKESKAFQKERLQSCSDEEKKTLNAEEMSEFYKAYLDKNWNRHAWYNFQWYHKNFYLVFLAWKVWISKVRNIFRKNREV